MKKITFITSSNNQNLILNNHIKIWNSYPKYILDQLDFIIVDNGKKNKIIIKEEVNFDLKIIKINKVLYREDYENLEWNHGHINIAFCLANTDWCFFTYLDHVVEKNMIEKFLNLSLNDNKSYYNFKRYNPNYDENHRYNNKINNSVFLINKSSFFKIGAFEEEMSGKYGYEDIVFNKNLIYNNYKKIIPDDIIIRNYSGRIDFQDSDYVEDVEKTWTKDVSTENFSIMNNLINNNFNQSRKMFLCDWEILNVKKGRKIYL